MSPWLHASRKKNRETPLCVTVGSFVCASLLFASCLLTSPFSHVYSGRGGYHSVKQYPHASLGVLLSSASSSCAFWEGDMNDFQKATRRWQSCKCRLNPGPNPDLTQVRFPRYKWLFSDKTISKKSNMTWCSRVQRVISPTLFLLYSAGQSHFAWLLDSWLDFMSC